MKKEDEEINSLPFELVDYSIDYIGFKAKLRFYKPGLSENYKIES